MWFVLTGQPDYWRGRLDPKNAADRGEIETTALVEEFQRLSITPDGESHHFGGRYENIYIDADRLPAVTPVLEGLRKMAALILDLPPHKLKMGFWFNHMEPGQSTSLHSHDDDDELLSAVYYLTVPPRSGDLVLHTGETALRLTPRAGDALFFAPTTPHEVTTNQSDHRRLSIAVNFGHAEHTPD